MKKLGAVLAVAGMAAALTIGLASCGGGTTQGGTVTVLMGTAPDYLDPQEGYTTQSAEATWISYTGLLTYKHASGEAGGELIPGLAESLPQISKDGKTYTLTLRKGLVYSNGKPVKASDFTYTVERAIRLNWGGKSFLTENIAGAAAFDEGTSSTISGIKADDQTGKITISLVKPYGAFANVIAFPSAGLVPTGTPMKNLTTSPPPGVGPYMITNVQPNKGWTMVKNPKFAGLNIPNIPTGHLDKIDIKINPNTQSEAQQVLNNEADNFDAGDTLPPSLVPQVESKASERFEPVAIPSTYYFFLNVTKPPFSNELARQAVLTGLDRTALQKLASGFLEPGCFFIPEGIVGHPTSECPYGDPSKPGDLAKAKQMVQESGMAGTPVTVWGENRAPRKAYIDYYADYLNKIGFKATPKIISDTTYFPTIGNAKTDPQTGFADWVQDFPNPSDFYLLMNAKAIQPVNNENFSKVNDPHIQTELARLDPIPSTELESVASDWQKLDEYTAKKAYVAVYGSEEVPKFMSDRIDFNSAILHPVYFNDWTSWALK
ncbi:MAG: ABC transporter substrate-binding protein [Solirubrobacterales bacterium]